MLAQQLERHRGPVPVVELRSLIEELTLSLDDVRPYLLLDPDTYSRNAVLRRDGFEILIFCWQSGQKSPIHDHSGSACGVRVISGTATEIVFERIGSDSDLVRPIPGRTSELRTGEVTASFDADIHEVSNNDPDGELLVTLHVYSPPLPVMNIYRVAHERALMDPVA